LYVFPADGNRGNTKEHGMDQSSESDLSVSEYEYSREYGSAAQLIDNDDKYECIMDFILPLIISILLPHIVLLLLYYYYH
jgi:hypothetical protein